MEEMEKTATRYLAGGGGGMSRRLLLQGNYRCSAEQMAKRSVPEIDAGGNSGVGTVQLPLPVMEVEVLDPCTRLLVSSWCN
jgi:hypothetical protein